MAFGGLTPEVMQMLLARQQEPPAQFPFAPSYGVEPAPDAPQRSAWDSIAMGLAAGLPQMPAPRGAGASFARGLAQGFAMPRAAQVKAREEGAAATAEDRRKQVSEAARELRRFQNDLRLEAAKAAMRPQASGTESILDKPFTREEAMRLKRPELEGVTRRDAGFFAKPDGEGPLPPGKKFDYMNTLRDNMRADPDIKDFGTVRDNYRRVERMSKMGQGVGDLAIIFSYMKVLDPTSVVRETEFKNAADAVGKLQQVANLPSGIVRGTRLTPEGRQWFLNASWELFKAKQMDYANAVESYRNEAKAQGVDASAVLKRYEKYLDDAYMGRGASTTPDLSKYVGGN